MNRQTWREYKKAHPEATLQEWLNLHTDKREGRVSKPKTKLDRVSKLYGKKKRF